MEEARERIEHNEKEYIATNFPKAIGSTEIAKEAAPASRYSVCQKNVPYGNVFSTTTYAATAYFGTLYCKAVLKITRFVALTPCLASS